MLFRVEETWATRAGSSGGKINTVGWLTILPEPLSRMALGNCWRLTLLAPCFPFVPEDPASFDFSSLSRRILLQFPQHFSQRSNDSS